MTTRYTAGSILIKNTVFDIGGVLADFRIKESGVRVFICGIIITVPD
jgi:hypothetical protein